jgi:hypothetical protein
MELTTEDDVDDEDEDEDDEDEDDEADASSSSSSVFLLSTLDRFWEALADPFEDVDDFAAATATVGAGAAALGLALADAAAKAAMVRGDEGGTVVGEFDSDDGPPGLPEGGGGGVCGAPDVVAVVVLVVMCRSGDTADFQSPCSSALPARCDGGGSAWWW